MFGQNPVRGREGDGTMLQFREIFYTLQGEGPFSGQPSVFLRLTGCNLRCVWCDTKWSDDSDPVQPAKVIAQQVWEVCNHAGRAFTRLVVLTGGEPLRQDISLLLHYLIRDRGLKVQIETAGTLWQDCLARYDSSQLTVVVSPKTPVINNRIRARADAFKYVIKGSDKHTDFGIPITNTQDFKAEARALAEPREGVPIYLSPCDEYNEFNNADNRRRVGELAMRYGHIAGLQLHKLLGIE